MEIYINKLSQKVNMVKKANNVKEVTPYGTGAHITVEKKHIGKLAKVTILKEEDDDK
jgi:putative transposon-encoded protein